MGRAYYNEIDPYAAQWLRNLVADGLVPAGDVDERSIVDVRPDELAGYVQCHFFAGLGGWPCAARLAGWPDDRPLWTGSPPCQPFSVAGKGAGASDARHLWPDLFRLARACRPPVLMGEQVAAAVGKDWLDGVFSDLEGIGYACRAAVVPACAVDAPHRRDRLWFVADAGRERCDRREDASGRHDSLRPAPGWREGAGWAQLRGEIALADAAGERGRARFREDVEIEHRNGSAGGRGAVAVADADEPGPQVLSRQPGDARPERSAAIGDGRGSAWARHGWISGADEKARRVEPGIRLLAHGVPARVAKLRALGNAIVPSLAAEIVGAYLDTRDS